MFFLVMKLFKKCEKEKIPSFFVRWMIEVHNGGAHTTHKKGS